MTVFTHGVFATVLIVFFGITSKTAIGYFLLGSALPDIDHPQSAIGRIFFFISYPLNKRFGHRTITHSMILWTAITIIGFSYFRPFLWLGLGAISHLFLDCWNLSGVALFRPITEKIFVMAEKKYRVKVGSKQELIIMVIFVLLVLGGLKLKEVGGMRGIVRQIIADYNTVVKDYEKQGLRLCYIEGKVRYENGIIENGRWLIIGKNRGANSLAIYDEEKKKVLKVPENITFLKAYLIKNKDFKTWNTVRLERAMTVEEGEVFYKVTKNWYRAVKGDIVAGDIIYIGQVSFGAVY